MSFFAIKQRSAYMALVTLVTLIAGSQTAMAKTIYITCGSASTYAVDLTNSTVNNKYKANITATNISFGWTTPPGDGGMTADLSHNISRVTSTDEFGMTLHLPDGTTQVRTPENIPCTESSAAPATKF